MAKIYGLFGSMTGKVADVVMAVRNGEQIARKYQPVVYNPNTSAQVGTRAKLKLLSQLSAIMASVIAIPRQGSVSSRNMFVKLNYPAATFVNDVADLLLQNVKLTKSVVSLPRLNVSRASNNVSIALVESSVLDVDRVVYAMFERRPDNSLKFDGSAVISTAGVSNTYPTTLVSDSTDNPVVVYAYGVRDNSEAARVAFGNLQVLSATTVASLITSRALLESDVTVTETVASVIIPTTQNAAPISNDGNRNDSDSNDKSVRKK